MNRYWLFIAILLAGCQSAPVEESWQASTLSEKTIAQANAAVLEYNQCLDQKTQESMGLTADSRAIADQILKQCENPLGKIKTAYDAENVPASISERYMRKVRSHGAQNVLRFVMSIQAMRSTETPSSTGDHK